MMKNKKHMRKHGLLRTACASLATILVATGAGVFLSAVPAAAQGVPQGQGQGQQPQLQALEGVAAVVNDKVISTYDVRQRIKLIALTSGGRIPEEALPQVQAKALRDLIEEQLKITEAQSFDFDIDPRDVEEELMMIAASSNSSVPELEQQLLAAGISLDTLRRQIHTRMLWQQLVTGRYSGRVRVSEDEIDEVMERLRAESRDEQYLVSEICLPVREDMSLATIEQAGMQIIGQLQQGAPFEAMARQFSACSSAANGGDMGWLRAGELDPALGNIVRQMSPGAVSRPVPFEGTVRILAMRDKREAAQQGEKSYEIGYVSAPAAMPEQEVREIFSKLPQSNICKDTALSIDLGQDIGFELLPMLPARQLEAPFRGPVEQLDRGEMSEPIRHGRAWHGMLLCGKDEGLGLPSRQEIEDRLFTDQLELLARRYLRDVEREASVDVRLGAEEAPNG